MKALAVSLRGWLVFFVLYVVQVEVRGQVLIVENQWQGEVQDGHPPQSPVGTKIGARWTVAKVGFDPTWGGGVGANIYAFVGSGTVTEPGGNSGSMPIRLQINPYPATLGSGGKFYMPYFQESFTMNIEAQYVSWGDLNAHIGQGQPNAAGGYTVATMRNKVGTAGVFKTPRVRADGQPVVYYFYDKNGYKTGEVEVKPGSEATIPLYSPDGSPITYIASVKNYTWNPNTGHWDSTPGTDSMVASGAIDMSGGSYAGPGSIAGVNGPKTYVAIDANQHPGVTGGGTEVGNPGVTKYQVDAPSGGWGTGGATTADVRAIGNQISSAVGGLEDALKNINVQLGDIDLNVDANFDQTHIIELKNAVKDARAQDEQRRADAISDASAKWGLGQQAGSVAAGAVASLMGGIVPATIEPTGGDWQSFMTITMPVAFGGQTIIFAPANNTMLMAILHGFRTALAWLSTVLLAVFVFRELKTWSIGFSSAQQAHGNAVLGGTGAQGTALLAAAAITAAVFAALSALVGWTFQTVTLSALRSSVGMNAFGSYPAASLGLLLEVFPAGVIIANLGARVAFNAAAVPIFLSAAAVIRFVIP